MPYPTSKSKAENDGSYLDQGRLYGKSASPPCGLIR
jgi:hypothetical protein